MAELVLKLSGGKGGVIRKPLPADDPRRRRPDTTRVREVMDWEPRVDVREGLKMPLDWFAERSGCSRSTRGTF